MKKLNLTVIINLSIIIFLIQFLISCNLNIFHNSETIPEVVTIVETVVVEDTAKIAELEKKLLEANKKELTYKNLIANLNELLSCVYYGYASNDKYVADGFTAFSLEYKGKYYLITAGHCVHYKQDGLDVKYNNFKFKANFSDEWIYPKLLTYRIGTYNDIAIFGDNTKINKGLKIDKDNDEALFYLCKTDIKSVSDKKEFGNSGSPAIDIEGEVVGLLTIDGAVSTKFNNKIILDLMNDLK